MKLERHTRFAAYIIVVMLGAFARHSTGGEFQLRGYKLTVPDGFTVEVVADEKLVRYPICADFDEQGRLYVAEASGAKDWNRPQPEETRHRVLRLEDTDGDGRFDRRTVFAEFEMLPQGCMWLDGSLYVAAAPIIWKLTDADDDGVAERREKWIETEEVTGCLNDLRGPYLGPDGWIYWCKGAGAKQTYQVDGKPWSTVARHIFRRHPDREDVEQVMVGGMDNPVEVAFSRGGERFLTNTNIQFLGQPRKDGILHAVYGGVYPKDISPVYDFPWTGPKMMPEMVGWDALSPCGLMRYESGEFGEQYRDNLFSALFSGHRVMRHVLSPRGATFQSKDEAFLSCKDVQFHPTDVLEDADGSLIVIETGGWYLHCCPSSTFYRPDKHGAIYRIRRKGAHKVDDPCGLKLDWENPSLPVVVDLVKDPHDQGSLTRSTTSNGKAIAGELARRLSDRRFAVRERAGNALAKCGSDAVVALRETYFDKKEASSPSARCLAVWAATRIDHPSAREVVRLALEDPDSIVRHAAASSISLWRDREAVPALMALVVPRLRSRDNPSRPAGGAAGLQRIAAEALGRIGDKRAVPALLEAASTPSDRFLEHSLIYALIEIGDVEGTRAGLSNKSVHTRRAAMIALDQMSGDGLDSKQVIADLHSPDTKMQEAAWWIASRHAREWGTDIAKSLRGLSFQLANDPEKTETLRRRLAQVARAPELAEWLVSELARSGTSPETQILILRAMSDAGGQWVDDRWVEAMLKLLADSSDSRISSEVIAAFEKLPPIRSRGETSRRLVAAYNDRLRSAAGQEELPDNTRLSALSVMKGKSIGRVDDSLFAWLLQKLAPDQSLGIRSTAAEVLTKCELTEKQRLRLAGGLKNLATTELNRVLDIFAGDTSDVVGQRLAASLNGSSAATSLNALRLRHVFAGFGPDVQSQSDLLFQRLEQSQADELARARRIIKLAATADPHRGLQVFRGNRASCIACHKAAYLGGTIGPSLRGIGSRRSEQDLAEAILFPSASITQGYATWTVATTDGRVVNGVILKDSPTELVLSAGPDKTVAISRDAIEEMTRSNVSVMPAGLDKTLSEQELADLIAYLKSL